jgi:hypothetical protein
MKSNWHDIFRKRIDTFQRLRSPKQGEVPVSIKVRINFGCFHREHSPRAYQIIDRHLNSISPDECVFEFEEHESGPEILVYVAAATAGITIANSIINLIITIIKARAEGIKKGDKPSAPVEIIVRRVDKQGDFTEEKVLSIKHTDPVKPATIEKHINQALKHLLENKNRTLPKPKTLRNPRKRIDKRKRRK